MTRQIEKPARSSAAPLGKGDMVVIRPESEIRATLNAEGMLDGMPFMPEMRKFCGQAFRVFRRADNVFLDYHLCRARLKETVLLEGLRCDGEAHDGCQMGCMLFWKESWLRRTSAEMSPDETEKSCVSKPELVTRKDGKYVCQATALRAATSPMPWWYPRQYLRAMLSGEATPRQLAGVIAASSRLRWRYWKNGQHRQGLIRPQALGLQAGDMVEVRGRAEIEATLDKEGKHRGLLFTPEMAEYCGRRFRVLRRIERMILEWTGEMRPLRDTVVLDEVICRGIVGGMCPRHCYHLWRECWLKRVE